MTNADKYLKDEKYIFDIAKGIAEAICYDDMEHAKKIAEKEIRNWFTSNAKPTLTEDERVILRNLDKKFKSIKRANDSYLYLVTEDNTFRDIRYEFEVFPNLFQFIKERRRIRDKGVAEMIELRGVGQE